MSYQVTRDELDERLREQRGFLRASAESFDRGDPTEALRLAVVVRVLVHDTRQSVSLLGHLGAKNELRYVDTALRLEPDEHVPPSGGQPGRMSRTVSAGLATVTSNGGPWTFVPFYDRRPSRLVPFDVWWTTNVSRGPRGIELSRRDVVLALANKEGGAHVDAALEEDWAAVTRAGSFATVSSGLKAVLNPVHAMMRQVAYELDETLSHQLPSWSGA